MESMVLVFDAAIQVCAAVFAGMTLDGRAFINNGQFRRVGGDADFVAWNYSDDGKFGARRFPALAAATSVVMQGLSVDFDLNLIGRAQALQRAACEIGSSRFDAVIQHGVKFYFAHVVSPDIWVIWNEFWGSCPRTGDYISI
jgi:hypothetical protein